MVGNGRGGTLIFEPSGQAVAARLVCLQQRTGSEHLWAVEAGGRIHEAAGEKDYVVALPALEAAYDRAEAGVRYHHSHPDDRALSPSDLKLLARVGVREVWAHTATGGSYGVALADGICHIDHSAAIDHLDGVFMAEIVQAEAPSVTEEDFEGFRDLAAVEALEQHGLVVAHIRLSDGMRRRLLSRMEQYCAIRSRFVEALSAQP